MVDARGLTDDVLTQEPRARSPRAWWRNAVDRLAGADPGLNQLRMGLQSVLGIALAVGLVDVFVRVTGALQLRPGSAPAPVVTAADHALLIVSMLLAGMVAMMAGFTVQDRTAGGQVLSSVLLPVPMIAAISAGLAIGRYRVLSLVFLVVVMAVTVYVRRWPPRGFAWGMVAFNGAFLGFFLHAQLGLRDVGWLAADLAVGTVASLVVRFAFFRPHPERTLLRMRRSWEARVRRLLALSVDVLAEDDERRVLALRDRLRRQLVRLNESTLMIDAQLADSRPRTAAVEAQRLFDTELALSNCARFAAALATTGAPVEVRRRAAEALTVLLAREAVEPAVAALRAVPVDDPRTAVLASRLAASVEDHAEARDCFDRPVTDDEVAATAGEFSPAVQLFNGFLPGSMPVSAEASTTRGRGGLLDRVTLPPYLRTTIQIAVAGTLAVGVGNLVSGRRLYWAVLAVFLSFIAASNSGEQARRALFRAGGTAIGIVIGDLLVHLTGGRVWASLVIVLVALFFGIYLIRVNYMFMTIGVTVTMAQLYVQFDEFSWQLLLLRLGETAIGVAAVIVTVLLIVPLRPQRVLTTAVLLWFTALRALLEAVLGRTDGERAPLPPLVRALDAAYAALESTAVPLRRATFGRRSAQLTEILAVGAAARQYARSLAAELEDAEADATSWPRTSALRAAADQLRASMDAVERRIRTGEQGCYVRSSSLVALALDDVRPRYAPLQHALRDLTLVDGTLARLAGALWMDVADHDTSPGTGSATVPEVAQPLRSGPPAAQPG